MSELFPVESVSMDSPRLAWIKKHEVCTYRSVVEPATWFAGFRNWWPALRGVDFWFNETGSNGDSRCGCGDTEDEAIVALAKGRGIPLWNEEAQP